MTEESRVSHFSKVDQKMSEYDDIVNISERHPHRKKLGYQSKKQVQQWLQCKYVLNTVQARLLLDKKQRQKQKKERLKAIEQQFQRKRQQKHKQIDSKLASSQQNKKKNVSSIQKKLGDVAKRHNSVTNKFRYQQDQLKQKWYNERKTYNIEDKPPSRMSNISRTSRMSKAKINPRDDQKTLEIERQMVIISDKLEKANSAKKKRRSQLINRIHDHNTSEIVRHQMRASQQINDQIDGYGRKIVSKIENAESNKKKQEESLQKKLEWRQKVYYEKLRSYQDNLRSLQSRNQDKIEQLNKKFENIEKVNKSWHNQRDQVYHQRYLANLSVIEQRKILRADRILQKHQQITAKNKIYKERQHSLFSAIKCNPSDY